MPDLSNSDIADIASTRFYQLKTGVISFRNEPKQVESLDKESRMLMEFEREYIENQKIMSQSGDESGSIDQVSVDNDNNSWVRIFLVLVELRC